MTVKHDLTARINQICLIVPFLLWCWLAMMAVHEMGHVLGALSTGGHVQQVVLHPFTISRTDVSPNPLPAVVVWSGPAAGSILPLVLWMVVRIIKLPFAYLARFFAGFCLVANGAYVSFGAIDAIGDPGEMLRTGSQVWQLVLFGAVTIPLGFYLWHGQGKSFGLGDPNAAVDPCAVWFAIGLFATTFAATLFFG